MLPTINGLELQSPAWNTFSLDRVLQYYDGPRLLLQRSQAGQLYLAWWSDSDDEIERWIYLPLSERRLYAILSGEVTSRDGLNAPEDGNLLVVDRDIRNNFIVRTVLAKAADLPNDTLPREGARLNIPPPMALSAIKAGTQLLDLRLESLEQIQNEPISAQAASRVLGSLQGLLDAIGHAIHTAGGKSPVSPASRGPIPNYVRARTRLDLVGTYAGSLGPSFGNPYGR